METAKALFEEAERLARIVDRRASDLQAELEEIEAKKAEIDAECDLARGAAKRLLNFKPLIGIEYQCPRCWVERGQKSRVYSIPSPEPDSVDVLRCETCRQDWQIPLKI